MGAQAAKRSWENSIASRVAAFGHRNWIVVADSAYPAQVAPGIETVVTGADHLDVLRSVTDVIAAAKHIRAVVHLDAELQYLDEDLAPGIDAIRAGTHALLDGCEVQSRPHEEIIRELDEAGKTFGVLLLKTNLTLPYTTVFLQLDCGYWSAASEQALRNSMKNAR